MLNKLKCKQNAPVSYVYDSKRHIQDIERAHDVMHGYCWLPDLMSPYMGQICVSTNTHIHGAHKTIYKRFWIRHAIE